MSFFLLHWGRVEHVHGFLHDCPEAAEPIDELLSAAIRYQDQHPPSLQGFLHWMRHSEETVKREAEAGEIL